MPGHVRTHYAGDYQARDRAVRAAAYANPATTCWRCGKTLVEHGPHASWDAGHVRDGDPTSLLAPEASSCNRSAGATRGNRMRGQGTTRTW